MVSYILLSTTIKSGNSLLFDGSSNHPPGCNVPPLLRSTKSTALKFSDSSSGVPVRLHCCFVLKPFDFYIQFWFTMLFE